jgi:hypothetical protein
LELTTEEWNDWPVSSAGDRPTGGRVADGASPRHPSALVFVLTVVWRNRQLRRVELAFATFSGGEWAWWIAMLVYAYSQGGVTESGIVATVVLIPAAVFPPAMTVLGERYALGSVLLAGYVAQALSCASVAIALFAGAGPLIVYVLLLGPAIAFTVTRPTQSSFAPGVARTPEELTATNVASGWIESVSMLAAPALAGVVLAGWSEATVFALVAAGASLGAILVAPLRNFARPVPRSEHRDPDPVRLGDTLRHDPEAATLVFLLGAQGVAIGALGVLSVEFAQGVLHRGGDWVGYLNAAFGAGGVVAVLITARLVGRARLAGPFILALAAWSLSFLGLAAFSAAVSALVLIGVAGCARATFDVAGRTLLQRVARPDLLSRHFGLVEGLLMGACAVGTLLVPLLVWLVGASFAWLCVGAILPLFAATAGHRLLDIDRYATVPAVEVALLRSMPLFAPLPPPTLESIARALEPVSLPAGVDVIRQGDEGHQFYVIADGEVEIVRDGRKVAGTLGRGEALGEIALIYDVPRTATVTTRRETQLYSLDREPFLRAVTGHPTVERSTRDLAEARLEALRAMDA